MDKLNLVEFTTHLEGIELQLDPYGDFKKDSFINKSLLSCQCMWARQRHNL